MSVSRFQSNAFGSRTRLLLVIGGVVATTLAGCATPQTAIHYNKGKEHFAAGKKWGKASQKVVADGQPVPRGGGQYLVGRPYRVAGKTYVPTENPSYTAVGMASWYGAAFHGRRTSNGEIYDMASITAAHPTMPLPSYARVTNLANGYSVIVRVNDRGPFHGGRVMDVSSRTADILDFKGAGTAKIKVEYVGRAPMEGSDDNSLLASLRTDGSPASLDGFASPVMVASAAGSAFGGIFSQGAQSAPPAEPAPEPVAQPAPPPAPEPMQEPIRVAEATPAQAPAPKAETEANADEDVPPSPVAAHRLHGPAPLPPSRPFDLGEISATIEVASSKSTKPVPTGLLPPRKPFQQASAERALYFSEADRQKRVPHAFDGVKSKD
jgi:rare lipoprotein A